MEKGKEEKPINIFQERVRIFVTVLVIGFVSAIAYRFVPDIAPPTTTLLERLTFTLRWQVFSFLTLLIGIEIVAMTRFTTPAINPMNKDGNQYVEAYNNCLRNTLEQLVLNAPGQWILCTYLDSDGLKMIPFLVGLFVIGRLLFWLGYPNRRAAGFALTFLATIVTYVLNTYYFFTLGPSFNIGNIQ